MKKQHRNLEQDRNDQGKFMQVYDEPLAKQPRCVRFPISVNKIIGTLPDQSAFIREAVINQLKTEGLLE